MFPIEQKQSAHLNYIIVSFLLGEKCGIVEMEASFLPTGVRGVLKRVT